MTSNSETVSRQMGKWATAKTMTSSGKQFTIIHKMLTAVTRDQKWPDVVTGISGRFSKYAFVLLCYNTYHLMTGPLGNSEFCFPRLRFSGNKIHCSPRNQSLSNISYLELKKQHHYFQAMAASEPVISER